MVTHTAILDLTRKGFDNLATPRERADVQLYGEAVRKYDAAKEARRKAFRKSDHVAIALADRTMELAWDTCEAIAARYPENL